MRRTSHAPRIETAPKPIYTPMYTRPYTRCAHDGPPYMPIYTPTTVSRRLEGVRWSSMLPIGVVPLLQAHAAS